jgi:hypothetical protein
MKLKAKKDERKLFSIRLDKDEYEAFAKVKAKENLPLRDSYTIKLFLIRYLGVNHE